MAHRKSKKSSSKQESEDAALASKEESLDDIVASKKKSSKDALVSKAKSSDILTLKLDAERRKSEAERVKLWLEAEEIRKRLHRKWYQETPTMLQWCAAGILAGVLLLTWVIGFRPVLKYEQEIARLEAQQVVVQA